MRALILTKPERVKQEFPPAHQFGMRTVAKHLGLLFKVLPAAFDPFDELCRRQRCGLSTSDPSHVPDESEALHTRQPMEHQPWIEIPSIDGRKNRPGIDRVIQTRRHRCLFWIKGAILVRLLPDALADFGLDPAKLPSPFAAHVERDELRLLKADFLCDHILALAAKALRPGRDLPAQRLSARVQALQELLTLTIAPARIDQVAPPLVGLAIIMRGPGKRQQLFVEDEVLRRPLIRPVADIFPSRNGTR